VTEIAAHRGGLRPRIRIRWISSTAGASTSARKTAVTNQRMVVSILMTTSASSAAAAAVAIATATILNTVRESVLSRFMGKQLPWWLQVSPSPLESLPDDPPADQPRASPSPPPPGGIALGGATAARDKGIRRTREKESADEC
jgi:hypothetical protein